MLTIVEKVIFLQEVDVFSEVATEPLSFLAAIVEEEHFTAGTAIYRDGDPATAMYIVVEGKVRLHRAENEIGVLGAKEAFGTWSLFDDEPRVTSATALEDAYLLSIDREDFVGILADNVAVTQGVLKAIVKRLRGLLGRIPGAGTPAR